MYLLLERNVNPFPFDNWLESNVYRFLCILYIFILHLRTKSALFKGLHTSGIFGGNSLYSHYTKKNSSRYCDFEL